jgi:hypothetical protein
MRALSATRELRFARCSTALLGLLDGRAGVTRRNAGFYGRMPVEDLGE